jgi:1-acyl-sn-glycerol-3-phosphate acyltransferase
MLTALLKVIFCAVFSLVMATAELIISPFNRTGNLYHALARIHARGVLAVCGVNVIVEGLEKVDFSRNYIYVSSHASFFDIPAVLVGIPDQIRIVYKKELEWVPIWGWALKLGGVYISIDRKKGQDAVQSLEKAAEKMRKGASVLLFPEGTRSPDGTLQPFKRGAFNLAMKAGVPIVPLAINGSFKIMTRHSWKINSGTITLVLDSPIEIPQANGKETELQLRDTVHNIVQRNYRNS